MPKKSARAKKTDVLLPLAREAADARRAVEQFKIQHEELIKEYDQLQAAQTNAVQRLRIKACQEEAGGEWPTLGVEVTVTPCTERTVDAVKLLKAHPELLRFVSKDHGPLVSIRLAAYDVVVDSGMVSEQLDRRVVTRSVGTPRVQVKWTKVS